MPTPRDVPIREDTIRLGQLLKLAGLADSGGHARELVQEGAALVNGEGETRRLISMMGDGPAASASRRQIISDVSGLRRAGEMNTYIDLLFLALIVLLCISKIVTE